MNNCLSTVHCIRPARRDLQNPFVHSGEVCERCTTTKLVIISHNFWGVLIQTKKELATHLEVGMDDTFPIYDGICLRPRLPIIPSTRSRRPLRCENLSEVYQRAEVRSCPSDSVDVLSTSARFISEVQGRGLPPHRKYIATVLLAWPLNVLSEALHRKDAGHGRCALGPALRMDARRVPRSHAYLCGLWWHRHL